MAIPSSGQLRLNADINLEINGTATGTNVSLQSLSNAAGFADPDGMFEFYGYVDAIAPTVTSSGSTNITTSAMRAQGDVTSDGGGTITERGFYFGTSSNYASNTKYTVSGTTGAFNRNFTGLSSGTTYYATAYAINSIGEVRATTRASATSQPSLSSILSFSCSPTQRNYPAQYASNQTGNISENISANGVSGGYTFTHSHYGSGVTYAQRSFNYVWPSSGSTNPQQLGDNQSLSSSASISLTLGYGKGIRFIGGIGYGSKSGYIGNSVTTHIFYIINN